MNDQWKFIYATLSFDASSAACVLYLLNMEGNIFKNLTGSIINQFVGNVTNLKDIYIGGTPTASYCNCGVALPILIFNNLPTISSINDIYNLAMGDPGHFPKITLIYDNIISYINVVYIWAFR